MVHEVNERSHLYNRRYKVEAAASYPDLAKTISEGGATGNNRISV